MSTQEIEKAERFHRSADRDTSIVARGALRLLLSAYGAGDAAALHFDYMETGKPHLADSKLEFNVSHSGEWVVIGVGQNRNLGVDIETIKREMDVMAIARRYFTSEEVDRIQSAEDTHAMFFQLWCRKEAYVKARGSALFRELSSFAVPFEDGEKDGWVFRGLEAGSRQAAAVVSDAPILELPCFDFGALDFSS